MREFDFDPPVAGFAFSIRCPDGGFFLAECQRGDPDIGKADAAQRRNHFARPLAAEGKIVPFRSGSVGVPADTYHRRADAAR